MKHKKRWIVAGSLVLLALFIIMGYRIIAEKNSLVEMLKIQDAVYVVTNEPAGKAEIVKEIGEIDNKIDRNQIPNNNFESNYLEAGTEIFSIKDGEEFPKTVVYKLDGKFYIATEAIER